MHHNFCLCCLKELKDEEKPYGFHKRCLMNFFGITQTPQIELSDEILEALAKQSTSNGITVAGVQKKLSLHLLSDKNETPRLTLIGYPQGYILKPQSADFPYLPEAEQLTMEMANLAGIQTVPHSLIYTSDKRLAYITKRIDRTQASDKIHMEDFCQLSGRLTEDKYKGSYEQCGKIIQNYSSIPGLDLSDFFYRIIFCFVTGNSDMHLKNFSLIKNVQNGEWTLSKAYDLLPVNLIMPEDKEETALNLNGKKSKLKKSDFLALADTIKLNPKAAEKMIEKLFSKKQSLLQIAESPLLPEKMRENFCSLISARFDRLSS